jgi:indolepyruvate ferredoxin oxidoreductase
VKQLLDGPSSEALPKAAAIATLPEKMRGYGHVKRRNVEAAKREQARLLKELRRSRAPVITERASGMATP